MGDKMNILNEQNVVLNHFYLLSQIDVNSINAIFKIHNFCWADILITHPGRLNPSYASVHRVPG
jgi:hypothetical protein